jgi:hypothetical protein
MGTLETCSKPGITMQTATHYQQANGDPVLAHRRALAIEQFPLWLRCIQRGELPASQSQVDAGAAVQGAVMDELHLDPTTWARLSAVDPAAIAACANAGALSIQWIATLLNAVGERCPLVPPHAFSVLSIFLQWLLPPQRLHMALATAEAIGTHAARWGWESVEDVLMDRLDTPIERPPYAVFAWVLLRLLEGANRDRITALDPSVVLDRSQCALRNLFSGSDLFELGAHAAAWKTFTLRGGLAEGAVDPPPALIEWTRLAGEQVLCCQLDTPARLAEAGRLDLWPLVESYQAAAFALSTDSSPTREITVTVRPTTSGGWRCELVNLFVTPELRVAVVELQETLVRATAGAPESLRLQYQQAAIRRERYSPHGEFFRRLEQATPGEWAAIGVWFPSRGEDDPVVRLRNAWPTT